MIMNLWDSIPDYIKPYVFQTSGVRGDLPLGVKASAVGKPFKAIYKDENDRIKTLGKFDTPEEAHAQWQYATAQGIITACNDYQHERGFNPAIGNWLLEKAEALLEDYDLGIETT